MTLINGSFENGWTDIPAGVTMNQQPNGWTLAWSLPGDVLLAPKAGNGDTESRVLRVPECVHKLSAQLPPDEQLGGKDALILDGSTTYKLFAAQAFRPTLSQQLTVAPGSACRLTVPVQVHGGLKPDGTPYNIDTGAAYWRVTINGTPGPWFTYNNDFNDREWMTYAPRFVAYYGTVDILIEFESHTVAPIDFFIDNVQFDSDQQQPVDCPQPREGWTSRTTVLVHFDAPHSAWMDACEWADADFRRHDVARAWDPGFWSPGIESVNIICWQDIPSRFPPFMVSDWGQEYYSSINANITQHIAYTEPPPPPPPPPPAPIVNYVPTGTKIGFHCIGSAGQTDLYREWVALGCEPPSVKAVQDVGWLAEVKAAAPHVKTIGRLIDQPGTGSLEWFDANRDPVAQARARMIALSGPMRQHKAYTDYWEIINEQDPNQPGGAGQAQLAKFNIEAMRIAEANGYKLSIFSYSMGVPEPDEWDAIADTGVFEIAAAGGHSISLHEYGIWPTDNGSLLCRYRVLIDVLKARGLSIPIYITEYAPDAWDLGKALRVMKAFESKSLIVSYKEFAAAKFILSQPNRTQFSIADGMGLVMGQKIAGVEAALMLFTDDDLMAQIAAYDAQVATDPMIAGVNVFTVGGFGSWPQFDQRWIKLYPRFTHYFNSVKERRNG